MISNNSSGNNIIIDISYCIKSIKKNNDYNNSTDCNYIRNYNCCNNILIYLLTKKIAVFLRLVVIVIVAILLILVIK